jgi:signal transduction histidine kinase
MSACSFVRHAVNDPSPLATDEARRDAIDDVEVISNALNFVHDLLRNMLDIHRAASKDLVVDLRPTDLLRDVLEPVASMLHQRRSKVQFLVECPEDLHISTDPLRLKQIVLNLSRNSTKFVDDGYIRLRAFTVDGLVEVSVEDSGPGIPAEKRGQLFSKFQKSLDSLSQGTVRNPLEKQVQEQSEQRPRVGLSESHASQHPL